MISNESSRSKTAFYLSTTYEMQVIDRNENVAEKIRKVKRKFLKHDQIFLLFGELFQRFFLKKMQQRFVLT